MGLIMESIANILLHLRLTTFCSLRIFNEGIQLQSISSYSAGGFKGPLRALGGTGYACKRCKSGSTYLTLSTTRGGSREKALNKYKTTSISNIVTFI